VTETEHIETEGLALGLQRNDGALLVQVRGEIDMANAEFFADQLRRLQADAQVVVDLAELEFIDSMGLTHLLAAQRREDGEPPRLRLRNLRGQPAQIVKLTRLDQLLAIEDDQPSR
jgi:anti-anti-sigma factor